MAKGVLQSGTPRIDFVWNYTSLPAAISHLESYHEPAYAYLLAAFMALFGSTAAVGCAVSLVFGVLAPLLTYAFARRHGPGAAVVAAALVALEPWSIYYSGVLMKETLVSVLVLLAIEGLRRRVQVQGSSLAVGLGTAAVVLAAASFEYELLPVLAITAVVALAITRRDALPVFLVATVAVTLAGLAATHLWLGAPLSGKLEFFVGRRLWTTAAHGPSTHVSFVGPLRFMPFGYIAASLLMRWYVPVLVLAWVGSRGKGLERLDLVLPATFVACYLYIHGVPHDLWERDFVPLLPVLAPFAAKAICRGRLWAVALGRGHRRVADLARGCVAVALIAGTMVGVGLVYELHREGVLRARWLPWTALIGAAVMVAAFVALLSRLSFVFRVPAVQRVLPVLAFGAVLAAYSQVLPWRDIYRNAQFPGFADELSARQQACTLLRDIDPQAPVMASLPAETHLTSGHPTVLLPIPHDPRTIEAIGRRYGVRYLLIGEMDLEPRLREALELEPVASRAGYMLYAFPGAMARHDAPPAATPLRVEAQPASVAREPGR
jgi:hypothetical protein